MQCDQAEQIEVYEPVPKPKPSPFGSFRTVADLKQIKPPTYNIDGLLQQGTTALLWGLPGSTKTTHAIDWWARLSLGLDWCDANPPPQ